MSSSSGTPAPPPPNGDEYIGDSFLAAIIVMTIVTIAAITLRFISRHLGEKGSRYWWDDWVALAAVPFIIALMIMCFVMLDYGLGYHVTVVKPEDVLVFLRLLWASYFLYDTALALTKASALLFFSRLFPKQVNPPWFNYAIYVTHGLNIAWLIGIVFGTIFMCNPVEKNWNPFLPGTCGPTNALWIGSAVPSVAIDLIILLLPLPKIWGLQMSRARKAGITVVFVLGYLVIIVSLGRLITVLSDSEGLNTDITYEVIPVALWVCAEAPVTILCISLPAMLRLGRHLATTYFTPLASRISSRWNSRGSGGSSFKSKSGNFSSATKSSSHGMTVREAASSNQSLHDEESLQSLSGNSMRGIMPGKNQYSARVQSGNARDFVSPEMPRQAIRVETDFKVNMGR